MRNAHVVASDDICSFCWKSALEVERDGGMEVAFPLLDLGSFGLLISINEPLEIILFELTHIWMILLLSNFDAFIPSVQLLVHSHRFFHFVVLQKDCFCSVELLVKHSQFCLHAEVLQALLGHQLVDLPQVVSLSDIPKGGITSFSYIEVLLFYG